MSNKMIRTALVGALATTSLLGAATTGAAAAPAASDSTHASVAAAGFDQPISRAEVIKRAKYWIDKKVPYSQSKYYRDIDGKKAYRQDCAGYVSMAWKLSNSRVVSNPASLGLVKDSHRINYGDLKAGDAMVKMHQHVTLFVKWADSKHTKMIVWQEQTFNTVAHATVWPASVYKGFLPYRYNKITG